MQIAAKVRKEPILPNAAPLLKGCYEVAKLYERSRHDK
jgi:hypothetical protein